MSLLRGSGRRRAFLRFLFAVAWLIVAYFLADKSAHGFSHGAAFPLIRNLFEVFLLIIGYSYMELAWDNTRAPLRAMGLAFRTGAAHEFALGAAVGWGMVTTVLLIVALGGHFYVRFWTSLREWELLLLQILILVTGSLAAEIAFRGYPFQKLIQVTGPVTATILAGIFFCLLRRATPGTTSATMWISGMAAVLLSIAYLRTRALWLSWGIHFTWLVSIGVLFGQPLAGNRHASSVIQTYADGPTWLTGSEYGPEASVITLIVLWIGLYILVRVTRDLARKYTLPELKPASIAIDPAHPGSFIAATPGESALGPDGSHSDAIPAASSNPLTLPEANSSIGSASEPTSKETPSFSQAKPSSDQPNK